MNMIMMVGLMVVIFFTSLVVMCHFREKMDPRIWNLAFIVADVVFFFCWNYADFERGALEKGWMTFENISPFVCTVIPLTLIMNDKVKQATYDALAFFSVGLFVALMISPEHAYLFNFHTEANFMYTAEAACHLVAALFGIYLVLSKQVTPDFKAWCRSLIFTYSVVGFGIFLDYVFHKTYFGMDPYGTSSIYMIDIFATNEITLVAYIVGVLLVLTIGMQCMFALNRALDRLKASDEAGTPRKAKASEGNAQNALEKEAVCDSTEGSDASADQPEEQNVTNGTARAYLFDFDGTLVDSMPAFGSMVTSVAEAAQINYPDDLVRIVTPLGYHGTAEYLRTLGIEKDVDSIISDMTRHSLNEYENNIPLKAGVGEALLLLRERGASLNVLTASPHVMLDPCLKRVGIYDLFDNVWSCDDFGTTKADPEIYRMAAERIGVPLEDILFIDDNLGALQTARIAGVRACGVYDESSRDSAEEIKKIADGYVTDLRELL